MRKPILNKIIAVLLLAIISGSCKNEPAKAPPPPVVPKGISAIKLFLDNSESNKGYSQGATEFKNLVADLAATLSDRKLAKAIQFNYISDTVYGLNFTDKQFIEAVSNSKISPITKCSEMHREMDMLTSSLDSFDIGILVSDCILSYCDTKGNPNKNRDNAPSELKTSVKSVFKKLSASGICASVYAFKSEFTGRYFSYANTIAHYKQQIRPFYVWIIGRKEQLNHFNQELLKNASFKPEAQLHFGFDTEPHASFDLFFSTGKVGECEINKGDISEIAVKPGKPVGFVMGVNLEKIPSYAQEPAYVKANLKSNFKHLKLKEVKLRKDFQLVRDNNREKALKENNTHFLYFEIEDLIENTPVEITLENKVDTWYEQWSTMDDKTVEANNEKTFALVHLINGVKEAYEVKSSPFLKTTLTLNQ